MSGHPMTGLVELRILAEVWLGPQHPHTGFTRHHVPAGTSKSA